MDLADELLVRSDAVADGFLAEAMQQTGEQFDEETVNILRSSFKTGWLMGYRAAIEEVT